MRAKELIVALTALDDAERGGLEVSLAPAPDGGGHGRDVLCVYVEGGTSRAVSLGRLKYQIATDSNCLYLGKAGKDSATQ